MRLITRNNYNPSSLFDDFFNSFSSYKKCNTFMSADISKRKGNYEIDIDIPGYTKEDLKVSLEDGYLVVSVDKDKSTTKCEEDSCEWIQRERFNGSYSRSFYLGVSNDTSVEATYHSGVLTIVVPIKDENITKTKYVEVK